MSTLQIISLFAVIFLVWWIIDLIGSAHKGKGMTKLITAASKGKVDEMKRLVDEGADVNEASNEGGTPLLLAVQEGQLEAVKWLIEKGADVNHRTVHKKQTALMIAALKGHTEIAKELLKNGARINDKDEEQDSCLSYARDAETLTLLIENGVSKNELMKLNFALREFIRRSGDAKQEIGLPWKNLAKLVIEMGVDVKAKSGRNGLEDDWESTPLHMAAKVGDAELVQLLLEKGADKTATDYLKRTPLYYAEKWKKGHKKEDSSWLDLLS